MTPESKTWPSPERLLRLIDGFESRRIVVLGDLVADEFVHGEIARVSREAPVLLLEHRKTVFTPGGGGNAVANLRALDARPVPVGVVGRDASGDALLGHFRSHGIPTGGIRREKGYETPTKSRILAGGVHTRRQQIVRIDRGSSRGELPVPTRRAVRERLVSSVAKSEALLISDYGYGVGSPEVARPYLDGRARGGLAVTVDSRTRLERFPGVTACTPNQEELERALDLAPLRSERAVEAAGRRLLRTLRNRALVLTRGARGMTLFERGRPVRHIPAYGTDEVADVTGAGDTVTAVFTLALASGGTVLEASVLANYAAGLVVMRAGTATVTRGELRAAVAEGRR